jgi:iron complex outermembrane receptor protein
LSLSPAAAEDYSTTTWGSPLDQEMERPETGAKSVIEMDDAAETVTSVADEIERSPSTQVRRSGGLGAPAYVSIRGSNPYQVRVVLDGIPLHGAQATSFDLSALPVEVLDRMTIYRSNVPVQLGAPLPGGVVSLQTRFRTEEDARVSLSYGSFDTRRAHYTQQWTTEEHSTRLSAVYSGAANDFDFHDDNGTAFNPDDDQETTRENAQYDRAALLLRDLRRSGAWRLTTLLLGTFEDRGVPGLAVAQAGETGFTHGRGFLALRAQRPRWLVDNLDLGLLTGASIEWQRYQDPADELGLGAQDSREWSWLTLTSAQPTVWLGDHLVLRNVIEWQAQGYSPENTENDLPITGAQRHTIGFGTEGTVYLWDDRLSAEVAVRGDALFNNVDGEPNLLGTASADDVVLWSPHVGIGLEPWQGHDWRVQGYATASIADRSPGFFELYGDRGTTVGNPQLLPEHRVGYDLGMRFSIGGEAASVGLTYGFFDRTVDDLIVFVENGLGVAVPRNVTQAALRGHEVGVAASWREQLRITAGYTLLDALNRTPGSELFQNRLPNRPVHQYNLEISARWEWLGARYHVDGHGLFYLDERERRPMPSRVQHDVGIQLRPDWSWRPVLDVTIRNITDERTELVPLPNGGETVRIPTAIADYVGFPLPGRAVYVTLTLYVAP